MSTPAQILEGVQCLLQKLATAFPATPTIARPVSGSFWSIRGGVGVIAVQVNKPGVPYLLTVRDLTAGVDLPDPPCPAPPVPSSFTVSVGGLVAGHDYRIRVEVAPPHALAADLPHAVYVTAM